MEYKVANIVKQLKEVIASRPELTLQRISDNTGVPFSTVSRIFAEGSENTSFRYDSIHPIATMLLDLDDLGEGNDDEKAYKAIIQFYETAINQMKEQYENKIDAERADYRRRIDFLMHQIELKDDRIDKLLNMLKSEP